MFNESTKAIYLQIAERICDDILEGRARAGERLPSVREYAAMAEVNANTVMRSYDQLATQGIIANRRGIGYFVADDALEAVRTLRTREVLQGEIPAFLRRLAQIGVTPDELKEIYTKYINDNQL